MSEEESQAGDGDAIQVDAAEESGTRGERWVAVAAILLIFIPGLSYLVFHLVSVATKPASLVSACCDEDSPDKIQQFSKRYARHQAAPNDTSALHALGAAYFDYGYYDLATVYLDSAIALDPQGGLPHYTRALTQMRLGLYETSAASMRTYQQRSGDTHPLHYYWGEWHRFQHRFDSAAAEYFAALEANPQSACTLNSIAINYKQQDQFEAALAYMDSALALAPDEPMFLANRFALHEQLGHAEEAQRDLERWRRAVGYEEPVGLRSFIPGREPHGRF